MSPEQAAKGGLRAGESLLWVGQPSAWRYGFKRPRGCLFVAGFFLSFAGAIGMGPGVFRNTAGVAQIVGSGLFLLLGLFFLLMPVFRLIAARRTVYAVTNQRLLRLEVRKGGTRTVKEWGVLPLEFLEVQGSPRLGKVLFDWAAGVQDGSMEMDGFIAIREPNRVHELIRGQSYAPRLTPRDEAKPFDATVAAPIEEDTGLTPIPNDDVPMALRGIVKPGELVYWTGRPDRADYVRRGKWPIIFTGIGCLLGFLFISDGLDVFTLGIAGFSEAKPVGTVVAACLWLAAPVVLGVRTVLSRRKTAESTWYAVTSVRILILNTQAKRPVRSLTSLNKEAGVRQKDGKGTITFCRDEFDSRFFSEELGFYCIDDPTHVCQVIVAMPWWTSEDDEDGGE